MAHPSQIRANGSIQDASQGNKDAASCPARQYFLRIDAFRHEHGWLLYRKRLGQAAYPALEYFWKKSDCGSDLESLGRARSVSIGCWTGVGIGNVFDMNLV